MTTNPDILDGFGGRKRVTVIGPVFPYRAGIAYCTTRLAEELAKHASITIISFKRQFPRLFYPGGDDVDPSLIEKTPPVARFELDVMNPLSWLREGGRLAEERPDVVIFVWWIWVWAIPYLAIMSRLPQNTKIVLQCHNVGHKEPAAWKDWLTRRVFRLANVLVVHAETERRDAEILLGETTTTEICKTFLPVHELGREMPSRDDARNKLGLAPDERVALFFGHVRPFKGLDIAMRAWQRIATDARLVVAGEVWWDDEEKYRRLAQELNIKSSTLFEFRFIPDAEIADYFAATDVVLAPYRAEAQSGVALTAFHFSRPVIATTVGGFPELIEEGVNGMLVPPEDPSALAGAIDRFFNDGDRAAMEEGAAKTARELSWERYALEFAQLL